MPRAKQPSRGAMELAFRLGRKVAVTDRGIAPQVHFASEFRHLDGYIQAHRYCIEQARVFAIWDEQLRDICDQEGWRLGFDLNDSFQWDDFFQFIATPMRAAFWEGWESAWDLPRIHKEFWIKYKPKVAPVVKPLKVAKDKKKDKIAAFPYVTVNVPLPGEKDSWEAITNKLFEQQLGKEDDESFWTLPDAAKIAEKTAQPV